MDHNDYQEVYVPPQLDDSQRVIYQYLAQQVRGKNAGMCRIAAAAGTGKSYLIRQFCQHNIGNTEIIAPTNKVCTLYTPPLSAKTIHTFMNARMEYAEEDGEINFIFQQEGSPAEYAPNGKVLFVDECSMVTDYMFKRMCNRVSKWYYICFVGDRNQIPPINEANSSAFTHPMREFTLTTTHRSRNTHILKTNRLFRKHIGLQSRPVVQKSLPHELFRVFESNSDTSIVLAYTNEKVDKWNESIRQHVLSSRRANAEGKLEAYYSGERLIFNGKRKTKFGGFIYWPTDRVDGDLPVDIPTGEGYEYAKDLYTQLSTQFPRLDTRWDRYDDNFVYNTSDIITIRSVSKQTVSIPYYTCEHHPVQDDEVCCGIPPRNDHERVRFHVLTDTNDIVWLVPCQGSNRRNLHAIFEHYYKYIESLPADPIELSAFKPKRVHWKMYHLLRNALFPDLQYTYSSTTHKAQGLEYKTVFIDIKDIEKCKDRRLAYTAVSRAKENIMFI